MCAGESSLSISTFVETKVVPHIATVMNATRWYSKLLRDERSKALLMKEKFMVACFTFEAYLPIDAGLVNRKPMQRYTLLYIYTNFRLFFPSASQY